MTERRLATLSYLNEQPSLKHKYSLKYLEGNDSLTKPASSILRRSVHRSNADRYGELIREKSASHTRVMINKDLVADSSKNRLQKHVSMADQIPMTKSRIKRSLEHFQKEIVKTDAAVHFNTLWKERSKNIPDHDLARRIMENREIVKAEIEKAIEEKRGSARKDEAREDEVTKIGNKPQQLTTEKSHLDQQDQDSKTMKMDPPKPSYRPPVPVTQQSSAKKSAPYIEGLYDKRVNNEGSVPKNSTRNPVLLRTTMTQLIEDIGVKSITNRQSVADIMDVVKQAQYDPTLVRELVEKLVQYKSAYEGSKNSYLRNVVKQQIEAVKSPILSSHQDRVAFPKPTIPSYGVSREIKPDIIEFSPPVKKDGEINQVINPGVKSAARPGPQKNQGDSNTRDLKYTAFQSKKLTKSFENIEETEEKTFKAEKLIEDIGTPKR